MTEPPAPLTSAIAGLADVQVGPVSACCEAPLDPLASWPCKLSAMVSVLEHLIADGKIESDVTAVGAGLVVVAVGLGCAGVALGCVAVGLGNAPPRLVRGAPG
jgi:hypothetical protein